MKKSALTATIILMVLLVGCRSKKEATAVTKENYDIEASGSASTATAARVQWLSQLSLDIDSFELFVPEEHFAEIGKISASPGQHHACMSIVGAQPDLSNMMGDTAMMPNGVPSVAGRATADAVGCSAGNMAARQPHSRSVVLRAKHASIGKSDRVERNSASFAQQADSVVAHRTMDKQEHTASDTVKVAKPPDLTWLSWAIIGGLIVVFAIIIWIEHE